VEFHVKQFRTASRARFLAGSQTAWTLRSRSVSIALRVPETAGRRRLHQHGTYRVGAGAVAGCNAALALS